MTDLEMTKLCAEALGYKCADVQPRRVSSDTAVWVSLQSEGGDIGLFDPLGEDFAADAQAMALVKALKIECYINQTGEWEACCERDEKGCFIHAADGADLNRAIVECVAKMRA